MQDTNKQCINHSKQPDTSINYVKGANIPGFAKVEDAMLNQGVV